MSKPFAESCEQNKNPILSVIRPWLEEARAVLEVGSGTGQHAVYFVAALPHLIWHTSDLSENHAGIEQWLTEAALPNLRPPLALDATQESWPAVDVDAIFTANTFHIMHWRACEKLIEKAGRLLPAGGRFIAYGPFNYAGRYTSTSNAQFDQWLKARDPLSGIRDFEALDALAGTAGLVLEADVAMPANNRTLCWRKEGSE